MCEQKFYKCEICGNFVGLLNDGNSTMTCCGQEMTEVIANSVENASLEKHIPKVEKRERLVAVQVGEILHPATVEHHIEFIYLQTSNGGMRKCIDVGSDPKAMFMTLEGEPLEVYAYCNIHGLWKTNVMCDCGCDSSMKDCDCEDDCSCESETEKNCCEQEKSKRDCHNKKQANI